MEWETKYPAAAWIRLVLFSLIGIAPHAVVPVGMIGIDIGGVTKLDHAFDPVVLILSIALPLVCLKMRDPGRCGTNTAIAGSAAWPSVS